jgi:predicted type IV restriction endonuclease
VEQFANYGALGIIVLAFLGGLVQAKPTMDRVIAERDRAEQQRDAVLADVLGKVAPALERSIEAVKARDVFDTDVRDVLVDVRRLLEQGP